VIAKPFVLGYKCGLFFANRTPAIMLKIVQNAPLNKFVLLAPESRLIGIRTFSSNLD